MSRSDALLVEHLLRRGGFGTSPEEMQRYKEMGYEHTLKELMHPEKVDDEALEETIKAQDFDFTRIDDLKRWWIYRMAYTKRPLVEKMTLFWHGHFATSNKKVNNAYSMYMQNVLFRRQGMGNFGDLLLAASKDPAMIVWLDNQQNKKGKPNENYAREILELFSLGIGNYTEQDIKEAARAFTGWQTKPSGFYFNAKDHDTGSKTFLGETGTFNGEDIVAIVVKQPSVATFLSTKLCNFFVADEPSGQLIRDVANSYTMDGDNIKQMMHTMFKHKEFRSKTSYHAKIKSPVELVVGTLKALQVKELDADLPSLMARMGQNLFEPPSVKGWDGGASWIATDTMMERFNFATRITQEKFDAMQGYVHPVDFVKEQKLTDTSDMVDYFLALLVDGDVPDSTRLELQSYLATSPSGKTVDPLSDEKLLDSKLRGLVHLIMTLPTYQLA